MARFACLPRKQLQTCLLAVAGLLAACAAKPARAQIGSDRYSSIVVDAGTGNVLEAVNPDAAAPPGQPGQADDALHDVRGAARPPHHP